MFKIKLDRDLKVEHPNGFTVKLKDMSDLEFTQNVGPDYAILGKALSEKNATSSMIAAPLEKIIGEVEGLVGDDDQPITVAAWGVDKVARLFLRTDLDFTEKIPDPEHPEELKTKRTFFWDQILTTAQRLYTEVPEKKV